MIRGFLAALVVFLVATFPARASTSATGAPAHSASRCRCCSARRRRRRSWCGIGGSSAADQFSKLAEVHTAGKIGDAKYAAARAAVVSRIRRSSDPDARAMSLRATCAREDSSLAWSSTSTG